MTRPDYCHIGGEPCQSLCDTPCGSGVQNATRVDDLAALVVRLAHALKKAQPDNGLPAKAMDYLNRHGLQPSPLRSDPG